MKKELITFPNRKFTFVTKIERSNKCESKRFALRCRPRRERRTSAHKMEADFGNEEFLNELNSSLAVEFKEKTAIECLLHQNYYDNIVIISFLVQLIIYPLDTLKTRLQYPNGFKSAGGFRNIFKGFMVAVLITNLPIIVIRHYCGMFLLRMVGPGSVDIY